MAERRQRILGAARTLIAERGFDGLTMRELARASRVTVPTIYNLIGGKQAVLVAAVEEQNERFLANVERGRGRLPAERLLAVIDACVDELLRLPAYYRTLLPLLWGSAAAANARARVERALGAELGRAVAALGEAGAFVAWVDPAAVLDTVRTPLGARALAWAAGDLDDAAFRGAARYAACLALLGVTRGRDRRVLEHAARAAQREARPQRGRRRASA